MADNEPEWPVQHPRDNWQAAQAGSGAAADDGQPTAAAQVPPTTPYVPPATPHGPPAPSYGPPVTPYGPPAAAPYVPPAGYQVPTAGYPVPPGGYHVPPGAFPIPAAGYHAQARVSSAMRAASADRERAVDVLKASFVQGRLGKDELTARVGQALAARTYADLAALTADLPAGALPTPFPVPMYQPPVTT